MKELYKEWCKETKRNGSILVHGSINEFFEWLEEKQYEILEFCDGYNTFYKMSCGNFTINTAYKYKEEYLLKTKSFNISKVKRLSDGEVFVLGDDVQYDSKENSDLYPELLRPYKIDKFYIDSLNRIVAAGYNKKDNATNSACIIESKNFRKAKSVLFTTEDGKEIRKGDIFYAVETEPVMRNYVACFCATDKIEEFLSRRKFFSTKEAAQEYLLLNKPCLSLKEVGQFYDKLLDFSNGNSKGLRELVKQKLGL